MLPPMDDIAWMLKIPEQKVEESFVALSQIGVLHREGDRWIVTNFNKRQETPSAERMRRMREREREKVTRHSDANSYSHDSASASASLINNNLIKLYESEIGTVTGMMSEKLMAAWDEYPHEWFEPAFGEAVRNNARKWNYVEAILKNWKAHGFQSKNGKGSPKKESIFDRERARIAAEEAEHGKRT